MKDVFYFSILQKERECEGEDEEVMMSKEGSNGICLPEDQSKLKVNNFFDKKLFVEVILREGMELWTLHRLLCNQEILHLSFALQALPKSKRRFVKWVAEKTVRIK